MCEAEQFWFEQEANSKFQFDLSKKAGSSSDFDSVLPAQPMVWIPKDQAENQIQNQPKTQNWPTVV